MHRSALTEFLSALVLTALCTAPNVLRADDTEIFETQANSNTSSRPRVLIVFDDSGSMQTEVVTRPPYDPSRTDYQGGVSGDMFNRIYWSTDGEPPTANSDQWFYASQNRCASSFDALDNQGFSGTAGARRWVNSSTTQSCQNICDGPIFWGVCLGTIIQQCETTEVPGRWSPLSTNANNPPHVECKADVIEPANPGNGPGVSDGFALENVSDAQALGATTPEQSNASGVDWGGGQNDPPATFYSANYVDYWNDPNLVSNSTRMAIAKDVVADLIQANTSVDFALATFNRNQNSNPPQHGGRIVRRLIEGMDASERNSLISIVRDDLQPEPFSLTPLCETMYEVYRYYTGNSVLYGNQKAPEDVPGRDTLAETSGSYDSPLGDCAFIYTILMTDGQPTLDTAANSAIESLTGETCADWPVGFSNDPPAKNCLPNLAGYMSTTDLDGDATNGDQFALTYTIGFGLGDGQEDMLIETANRGGGQHFTAQDADTLATAFQGALLNILTADSTFTSPAVAVDSFTRTESRDDVFFAMFKPNQRVDWRGNVKRFKVAQVGGESVVVDKTGVPAFDEVTGEFKDSASSFWSDGDGGAVEAGGVGELLANRDPATRVIYTNTGPGGALESFNSSNITPDAFGFADEPTLWAAFGVANQTDFDNVLAWARGFAIQNGVPSGSPREWIMGDVLHSRPFPVNYGALGSFTKANPDQRILVGTNAGFVHFFGNEDGQEDWAFFPKELAPVLNQRRINLVSNDNVYGVDLTPAIYRKDVNGDGTISAADGDTVWAYLGLRRGGRALYALDISNPDSPSFLWMVAPDSADFAELGQTWSRPVAARIPGYVDGSGVPRPVLIFGGGYDTNKDSSAIGSPDSMGRGIFVVDAETGALVRSITPAAASATNLQEARLVHAVPGEVATLDSNGDELVDRLYFGDTGGNVWRVDIGPNIPSGGNPTETWFVSHFADLNDGTVASDRRFFNKPDIVRTTIDGKPIDAVLLGSGDRTNPLATDVQNFFYMLRDPRIAPYSTPDPELSACDPANPDNLPLDFRCGQPIGGGALFDITSGSINTGTEDEQADARAALAIAAGWKLALTRLGEKNLSNSITVGGEVIFSTFTPSSLLNNNPNICEPSNGVSRRLFVDIFTGGSEETLLPQGEIPGGSTLFVDGDGTISVFNPPGTPPTGDPDNPDDRDCAGGLCDLLQQFPVPYGNYWYSEEF